MLESYDTNTFKLKFSSGNTMMEEPVVSSRNLWLYLSVKSGNEAQISIDSNSKPDYREKLNEELRQMRESEMWQAGMTVRKLRPENN